MSLQQNYYPDTKILLHLFKKLSWIRTQVNSQFLNKTSSSLLSNIIWLMQKSSSLEAHLLRTKLSNSATLCLLRPSSSKRTKMVIPESICLQTLKVKTSLSKSIRTISSSLRLSSNQSWTFKSSKSSVSLRCSTKKLWSRFPKLTLRYLSGIETAKKSSTAMDSLTLEESSSAPTAAASLWKTLRDSPF